LTAAEKPVSTNPALHSVLRASRSTDTLHRIAEAGLDAEQMPEHIAVIMDGNGRWANQRGLPRVEGHARGVGSVRATVEECCRLGIGQLTLYCLSSENWKRPQAELDFLMTLLEQYLLQERSEILEENIRFSTIGRREGLPDRVLAEIDENVRLSQDNTGMGLCLAINYGSRTEMIDAVRTLARQAKDGLIAPDSIDESAINGALYTAGMPDPDLLIRTAGEMRVSNFLLWQISYAELWVTDRCWPEFDSATLHQALRDYAGRERRFGGLK
jgi:undecaprenyl diphosphate synthase